MVFCPQDCLATIPPYPHYISYSGDEYDVASSVSDPYSMWIVRLQLFFNFMLCPLNTTTGCYKVCLKDIPLNLVFFSAFDGLCLLSSCTMESNGIRKIYETSPAPTLYVGRVEDLQCYLDGTTNWHHQLYEFS